MKTKIVLWTAATMVIPNHGKAITDEFIELPEKLADQFVKQGKASIKDAPDPIISITNTEGGD